MGQYLNLTDIYSRLPEGSTSDVMKYARTENAMPAPDVSLSIVVTGRARAVVGWKPERAERWLALAAETTRGAGLRYRHLRFLKLDREPWWDVDTEPIATSRDLRAVCTGTTRESLKWCMRSPEGWWHAEAITVGNRTGWPLPVARRIITELALPLDLTRWAHLSALAATGELAPSAADRQGHLAALTTDAQ